MDRRDNPNRSFRPNAATRDTSSPGSAAQLTARRYDSHRPRTPPLDIAYVDRLGRAHGQGIRAPRARPSIADAFPDALVRLPDQLAAEDERRSTSHELSFPHARDSLVDQILMSLDPAFPDHNNDEDEDDEVRQPSQSIWSARRARGHTHSSSTSSALFRFGRNRSRSQSRGKHQKNKSSGSDFQGTSDRNRNVRTTGQQYFAPTSNPSVAEAATPSAVRAQKSSNDSAFDRGQAAGNFRRIARRSISLDLGHSRNFSATGSTIRHVNMDSDHDQMSDFEGVEAARTASDFTGVRRRGHNGSVDSEKSHSLRPSRSNTTGLRKAGTSPHRPNGSADNSMPIAGSTDDDAAPASIRDGRGHAPPIPSTIRHRTGPSNTYKVTAFSPNATTGRDKGGFFKRMFGGGSKGGTPMPDSQAPPKPPPTQSQRNDSYPSVSDEKIIVTNPASSSATPDTAPKSEPKEPATLNKKASFFRRRKKSIAAPPPPVPMLPSSTAWQDNTPSRDQSPASSLRKVMNPYLANSRPGTRAGRTASRGAGADQPERQNEVRLFPTHDATHAYTSESSSHAHPVPSPQPVGRQTATNRDEPRRSTSQHRDHPVFSKAKNDQGAQDSDLDDRPSRRKTITAATSSGGAPTRSSSKGWRDRPQTRVFPLDQPQRSTSTPRRPVVSRSETEASEVSDSDFTSAKSQVVSPIEDSEPELIRPPLPKGAPPVVPTMAMPAHGSKATTEVEEPLFTSDTAKLGTTGRFVSTLDPARTPSYDPQAPSVPSTNAILGQPGEQEPTDRESKIAARLFRFNTTVALDEPLLPKNAGEICPWLGEAGEDRARIRKAYLQMFDWKDTSTLAALRKFCEHVKLSGETQQVDRVLEGIARRWTECNPSHGFKVVDVVHTVCYSLLLLNTDLHVADIDNRMTRGQFVKNTMQTITRVVDDAVPDAFKQSTINAAKRASTLPPPKPSPLDLTKQGPVGSGPRSPQSPKTPHSPKDAGTVKLTIRRNSNEFQRGKFRLSARPSDNTALETLLGEAKFREAEAQATANEDCGPLVKQPFFGGRAAWETQMETVLKNFYTGIQKQRLPLQGSDAAGNKETSRASSSLGQNQSASKMGRSASISSRQSGAERSTQSRPTTGTTSRWRNKIGQRPKIYAASNFSVDDDRSFIGGSPSASSLWSKHSLGRTQPSMSMTSLRSEPPGQEAYQQSIGFANALSQAIIREESAHDGADTDEKDSEAIRATSLLDDDSLELYGAPWAKEGNLFHKHHFETVDKRARDRAWTQCFAVIEKGWLQLFKFPSKTASIRARTLRAAVGGVSSSLGGGSKAATGPGGKIIVGGGNWMDNAQPLGKFLLRHTIASTLPPPGYSPKRPFVWALTLPHGAIHLFEATSPELVKEYVTCANYWSARLSKEPLVGGVSNVEYGWGDNILGSATNSTRPTSRTDAPASSMAEVMSGAMSRERSASSESSAAPAPGVPRTSSRGMSGVTRPPSAMHSARPSLQNSIRNSFDTTASAVVRPRLPGDRAVLHDWKPPQASMVASALMEVDQLRVLTDYVAHVKQDLEKHNELRPAIQATFNSRHPNYAKAMSNFEKKSAYLLHEIVKFGTYMDTLTNAQTKKEEVLRQRDQRKKDMEAERAQEELVKVETAEELRRELSRSDLRKAAKSASEEPEDVPEVPALPDTGMITKS